MFLDEMSPRGVAARPRSDAMKVAQYEVLGNDAKKDPTHPEGMIESDFFERASQRSFCGPNRPKKPLAIKTEYDPSPQIPHAICIPALIAG
jgi:hypothetical protein